MMYAAKLKIRMDKLLISSTEKRYLYDDLTLKNLSKIVFDNEVFDIHQIDDDYSYYLIEIHKERYETDEEQASRIARQEKYNQNYEIFHKNKRQQ